MIDADSPRPCPVCDAPPGRTLFHQEFAEVDQATPVSGYDVVVCQRCGCGYADGIPSQAAFDRYYKELSKYEYAQRAGAESEYDARRFDVIADALVPYLPSSTARILDVGCASGRLLATLRDRGFVNVMGLDPSASCAAAARRLYAIDVRTMTLGELAACHECFDVVVMVGVLEHVRDLRGAFGHLRTLLNEEGRVYVEVPDATAFADWPNAPYQDFSTEHINFFAPTSLENLFRRFGFGSLWLERNHREQSYRTTMSNISAVYSRRSAEPAEAISIDSDTAGALERYIAQCAADEKCLRATIDAIVDGRRRILVWGVGTLTRRLLATSRLADANIVAFVESNPGYHGKALNGVPIVSPDALKHHKEPVLISSRVFQKEITDQIRNDLGCANELILLYNV